MVAYSDVFGRLTEYDLDTVTGKLLIIKSPDTSKTRFSYNSYGQLVKTVLPDGKQIKQEYDELGRLIASTDEKQNTTRFFYKTVTAPKPTRIEESNGSHKIIKRTLYNQVSSYQDCSEKMTVYHYDRWGHVIKIQKEEGVNEFYQYDVFGQLTSKENALGKVTRYSYNQAGDTTEIAGTGENKLTMSYNPWGLLTSRHYADLSQHYSYDSAGRIRSVTNENGAIAYFNWNMGDLLTEEIGFDGRKISYQYDEGGNLLQCNDESLLTQYIYNAKGKLDKCLYVLGESILNEEQWEYSENKTTVKHYSGDYLIEVSFQRENEIINEELSVRSADGSLCWYHKTTHVLQPNGTRIQTFPDGLPPICWQTYGPGYLLGLSMNGESLVEFDRDSLHREKELRFGNSSFVKHYRGLNSISNILVNNNHNHLLSQHYYYDEQEQLSSIQTNNETYRFKYSKSGKLLEEQNETYHSQYYYDPAGNRFRSSDDLINHYWRTNRHQQDDKYNYFYDCFGNLINKVSHDNPQEQHHLAYDTKHRLVHYQKTNKDSIEHTYYCYDPLGRRIGKQSFKTDLLDKQLDKKMDKSCCTWYGWDGDKLVLTENNQQRIHTIYYPDSFTPLLRVEGKAIKPRKSLVNRLEQQVNIVFPKDIKQGFCEIEEVLLTGKLSKTQHQWLAQFNLTAEQLLAFVDSQEKSDNKIHLYHCNHLGTPIALFNMQGQVDWQVELDAWGNVINEHNPYNLYQPIRMQGQHYDKESGLYYNRHRYLDPTLGRYITQDPIRFYGGINSYDYVSNPLMWVDPWGLVDLNLFPTSEAIHGYAENIKSKPDVFQVGGHGNSSSMVDADGNTLTAAELAELIRKDPDYKDGMSVELLSCNVGSGKNSFAQQVADELGATVTGADQYMWYSPPLKIFGLTIIPSKTNSAGMNNDGSKGDSGNIIEFKPGNSTSSSGTGSTKKSKSKK